MKLIPINEVLKSLSNILTTHTTYEPKVVHHFSDGVCVRELHLKAGDLAIGAEHNSNHLTFLSFGTIQIRIGEESKLLQAPCTFESLAGSRKIAFAYTDCVISNIIPTNLKDIKEIEDMFTSLNKDKGDLQCQLQ